MSLLAQLAESAWLEFISLTVSLTAVIGYWYWINHRTGTNKRGQLSTPAQNRLIRQWWVQTLDNQTGAEILAVQTLRNAIMVSTALASATMLILLGVFTLIAQRQELVAISNTLLGVPLISLDPQTVGLKLLLLAALQISAFFCFLTAIRYYGHISFLVAMPTALRHAMQASQIATPPNGAISHETQPDPLPNYLQRAGSAYAIGIRIMIYSIPLFSWLLGNLALLVATALTVSIMYWTDRAPH
ncbi:DUF599 domain-containing protein [Parvibium lacunae]|nr:DUF599 domain-containing protein [Parvibium lacunae]